MTLRVTAYGVDTSSLTRYIPRVMENRIRELRTGAGMTQERLAQRAGLTLRTIVRLEQQEHLPQTATAKALADALGLPSIADLFVEATV